MYHCKLLSSAYLGRRVAVSLSSCLPQVLFVIFTNLGRKRGEEEHLIAILIFTALNSIAETLFKCLLIIYFLFLMHVHILSPLATKNLVFFLSIFMKSPYYSKDINPLTFVSIFPVFPL